jgi:hypothetical protein
MKTSLQKFLELALPTDPQKLVEHNLTGAVLRVLHGVLVSPTVEINGKTVATPETAITVPCRIVDVRAVEGRTNPVIDFVVDVGQGAVRFVVPELAPYGDGYAQRFSLWLPDFADVASAAKAGFRIGTTFSANIADLGAAVVLKTSTDALNPKTTAFINGLTARVCGFAITAIAPLIAEQAKPVGRVLGAPAPAAA